MKEVRFRRPPGLWAAAGRDRKRTNTLREEPAWLT